MTKTKLYTQRSVVSELIGIETMSVQFGKTISSITEGVNGEKVELIVSKTNVLIKVDKETYIIPFESITNFYIMSYSSHEIVVSTKNIDLRIELKHTEEEE